MKAVGRIAGHLFVQLVHVLVVADENQAAGVAAQAPVALQQDTDRYAVDALTHEEQAVESQEEPGGEGSVVGGRKDGGKDHGQQDDVAEGFPDDVVRTHDAPVQDDAVLVIAQQVDQIEQDQNLWHGIDEAIPQEHFIKVPVKHQKQQVQDA